MAINVVLIGRGATGTVYLVDYCIVVKTARVGAEDDHRNEQQVFKLLERAPRRIPYLIRFIHAKDNHTFLEHAQNGSLAELLNKYQTRNEDTGNRQVIAVTQKIPFSKTRRWMRQLCQAAVGFHGVDRVHGDIRPGNLLFSSEWHLRLGDLDRSVSIDDDLEAASEPFARLLNKTEGEGAGTYGSAGLRTEAFAIGSIFYTLLRGYEPFEMDYWGKDHDIILMDKFQNKEFPPLNGSANDIVIQKCWNAEYDSLKELLAEFTDDAKEDDSAAQHLEQTSHILQEKCKEIARNGVLDGLERF